MKTWIILISLIGFTTHSTAQSLSAKVLESSFYLQPRGFGQNFLQSLDINPDSIYQVLETKVQQLLVLQSIDRIQEEAFIFQKRKKKAFSELTDKDRSLTQNYPADLYLIFQITVDPPYPSALSGHLIKTAIEIEIFIFDKSLNQIQKISAKRKNTGITSDPNSDEDDPYENAFFDFDRESFLDLFDKTLSELGR